MSFVTSQVADSQNSVSLHTLSEKRSSLTDQRHVWLTGNILHDMVPLKMFLAVDLRKKISQIPKHLRNSAATCRTFLQRQRGGNHFPNSTWAKVGYIPTSEEGQRDMISRVSDSSAGCRFSCTTGSSSELGFKKKKQRRFISCKVCDSQIQTLYHAGKKRVIFTCLEVNCIKVPKPTSNINKKSENGIEKNFVKTNQGLILTFPYPIRQI